ncbi:bifunctional riboflavin kinase/FAD synthetase [Halalkalibacillus halophilus]|uniref:bifunctional riboflavin kinase/FAD synthetase n=1 Tax=Halalkalibacillus halophilus TaxID=392827 RepID=UPI0004026E11|nr:bifunctional riboflavin kinase/FAD synthetase [Halalkalibacillus halophilus]
MQVIYLNLEQVEKFPNLDHSSIAVGYFDGVHKGHQAVINEAISQAKLLQLKSGVMTFDPHPLEIIKGQQLEDYILTPLEEKINILEKYSLDYLIVVRFDQSLAKLSPQQFVDSFMKNLNMKHVVGGYDFAFGHKGKGKIQDMDLYTQDELTYSIVDKITEGTEKISSTLIREKIDLADLSEVENLLGRNFAITGKVVEGYKRGREIGYKTANLDVPSQQKIPKIGVYATIAEVNGKSYYGMTSVGYNPTFENEHAKPIIEVHLFNFDEEIYGHTIQVQFVKYIREELKFEGVDPLIKRIQDDEAIAKSHFNIG